MWPFGVMLAFASVVCCFTLTVAKANMEMLIHPGLRRPQPPANINWASNPQAGEKNALAHMMEDQVRRRWLLQMRDQNLDFLAAYQLQPYQRDDTRPVNGPDFTYNFPTSSETVDPNEPIGFAVNPSDPRFYNKFATGHTRKRHETTTQLTPSYNKIRGPLNVNPLDLSQSRDVLFNRHDLLAKIPAANGLGVGSSTLGLGRTDVVQTRVDNEAPVEIYLIGMVAAGTAAVTVGLIALGIGWFTLQKKAKAAADVEYPAYGVTGPNKNVSPSGDRRLAQSAQMYHYQHQKQQIIAMEGRSGSNSAVSDGESEDEEGDYTVYECPGLAPTGEMEVKNPLFLDDPTPATPATGVAIAQPTMATVAQQPSTVIIGSDTKKKAPSSASQSQSQSPLSASASASAKSSSKSPSVVGSSPKSTTKKTQPKSKK